MELKIYDKANNLRLTASPNSSSTVAEEIGGECSVSASFTHTAYVPLDVDDYIDLEGVRYKVKSRYRPKQKNTQTYEYSVKFYAPLHDAEDTLMLFQEGGTTSEFSYDGSAREHLQLWIDNMNRRAGAKLWSIGTVIDSGSKTISYRNVKCWDAAFGSNGIAATFETEMWADGYVINLCKAERGEMVELGYLHGLTNLAQEDNGEVKFFTRLFPLGSTRNIDATKYGYSRLQLPDRSLYVDKNVDLYGVKEETEEAAFSEIYPQYVGTVSSVRTEEKTSEEGRKYTVYYFKDNGMNWNPKDYEIPDLDYMLQFQTGELAGRGTNGSFQAAWHEDTKEWEIINVYPDETTQIPGGVIVPNPGDQYIPWNFAMPQEYITAAEQEYKQAVNDFLNTYSFDPNKYNGTTDRNYIEKNGTPLRIGWNVRLLSEQYFGSTGGYKNTRIIKVQRKLNDLCQATITCSDEVGSGWKSSVDNSLGSLQDANHNLSQSYEKLHNDMMEGFASIKNLWELKQDDYGNYYIYTKYNILGRKGITSYAEADVKVPSVFDGLPLDNTTIRKNPETGLIEVIGGTGTSFDENAMWSALSGSSNNQINKSHLTTVLAEYATAESVSALTTELNKKWTQDDTKIKNWDTAFGWGDHSKAGYAHLANEEAFTGLKHFTAGLSVGESKKKIYEENGVVYIDADVAVTGAMTFYASAGRSVSTIMDGVTVDEETITKGSDNVLRIKNAGAGSSFDENAMWSALSGSSDNQINKSHLTNALAGYATESWVTGKGYATESWVASKNYATTEALNAVSNKLNDFLEGSDTDSIINKWKELEAFLSGMAETDNLAEILETKADKKYVDSTFVTLATKQTITGEKTFSSVLNTAAIKASGAITAPSLAASDWVTIAGIKLRKLEDGALMLEGNLALTGALTMYASNGQSFDTIYNGLPIDNDTIYWQEVDGSRVLKAREGSGSSFDKSAMWTALAGSTTEQINKSHLTTALTGYATESWVSGKNYAVKATTLAGYGITDGINAVSVTGTGNAVTAASISGHTLTLTKGATFNNYTHPTATATTITAANGKVLSAITVNNQGHVTSVSGKTLAAADIPTLEISKISGLQDSLDAKLESSAYTAADVLAKLKTVDGSNSGLDADLLDGTHKTGLFTALASSSATNISITVGGTTKSIADLFANSAAKLETARTLWGRSFDGTANISGNLDSVGNITLNRNAIIKGSIGGSDFWKIYTKEINTYKSDFIIEVGDDMDERILCRQTYWNEDRSPREITLMGYSGEQRFIDVYINGIRLHKTADGVITLEGNLAVTGGVTMYAVDPVSASTVMDGVAVDGTTIAKVDGVLKVLNAGGGEAGSVAWGNISGKPSVFATNIANITDLHSSWDSVLAAQKPAWLTAVSIATISDLHANWDALLKAAPSAYVTRWPTISEVTGKRNLIVKLNGGTTEGTNQFTYNATGAKTINITPAGIGAATSGHTHAMSAITDLHSSWDALLKAAPSSYVTRWPSFAEVTSKPTTLAGYGITDAPTKTGSGASGTWGIAITGNAGTATKLQTARTLWGRSFDGTGNVSGNLDSVGNITLNRNAIIKGSIGGSDFWKIYTKEINTYKSDFIIEVGDDMDERILCRQTYWEEDSSPREITLMGYRGEQRFIDVYINGIRLHKTADGVITLEGNLAVTGGITTYAIDPVSASTVMDGVVVDGTTITKVDGVLKVLNAGGGEAGSVAWGNISGKPSVFATNIANITDLHSSWDSVLAAQKPAWLTAVSIATISDLHANWDALLKAAPSAYVTRWPTISEVTGKQNLVVKLNGGTTEGTNQFTYNATGAKTINITPAGIGAAASSHNHSWSNITSGKPTTLAGYGITDAPTKTGSGASGTWGIGITGNAGSASKLQTTHTIWGKDFNGTQNISGEISDCTRIRNSNDSPLYLGNSNNESWVYTQDIASHNGAEKWAIDTTGTAWFKNINIGYAYPARGNHPLNVNGVISGYAYTGRNIRIECDNAGNILEARASGINNYNGKLYLQHDSSLDLICCKGGGNVGIGVDRPTNGKLQVDGTIYTNGLVSAYGYSGNHIRIECDNNGGNRDQRIDEINNYTAPLYLQHNTGNNLICCNGGGNVGIGTTSPVAKLDVNGDIFCRSIESIYTSTANEEFSIDRSNLWCKAVPVIPNYKYRYVLGWQDRMAGGWTTGYGIGTYRSNDGSWGSMTFEVCQYESNKTRKAQLEIRGRNNILWFSGDILAEGGGTFYGSDIRYKQIVNQVELSLEKIAKAPSFVYHWNKEGMKCDRLNLGGSAQYTQTILPWAVEENDNFLSMDYATVAYTFAVHTARHLLTYETRTDKKIKKLENRVKYLEKQLKKLGYEEAGIVDDQSV